MRRSPFALLILPVAWIACFSSGSSGSGGGADFDASGDTSFPDAPGQEAGPDVVNEMTPPPQDASVDVPVGNDASEAAPGAVAITVFGASGPEKGITIVYGDATGAVAGTPATTGATGMVNQALPAGATMITALLGNANNPSPYTVMGVQAGDTIIVPDLASLVPYGQGQAQVTALPASPPANTAGYNAIAGLCTNSLSGPPIAVNLQQGIGCIGLGLFGGSYGAAVPMLVDAQDANGNVLGFTFQKNNALSALDAGILNLSLAADTWSTSLTTQTLVVSNQPDGGSTPNLVASESANDILHRLNTQYVNDDAGGQLMQVTTHVGYADRVQVEASISPNGQWSIATATAVAPPTTDGTLTIDATPLGVLPQISSTGVDQTNSVRPILTWTTAQGSLASTTTGLIGTMMWDGTDDAGAPINGNWTIVAPSSATALQAPALPASAGAYEPTVDASIQNMLQGLVGTAVPSYGQLRTVGAAVAAPFSAGCVFTPIIPYVPAGTRRSPSSAPAAAGESRPRLGTPASAPAPSTLGPMASPDTLVGRTIAGKFLVEGLIGSGAMGAVYRARQIALEKTVAIKVLHGEHADEPHVRRPLPARGEGRVAPQPPELDAGHRLRAGARRPALHRDGVPRRPQPAPRPARGPAAARRRAIADILMQTLAALAAAHDMGVVHRDLKPENIVVLSGHRRRRAARRTSSRCATSGSRRSPTRAPTAGQRGERDSAAPVTTAGFLVGTPEYMSPEQGKGEKLDARSDLYSVGVVLFEMLTGRVPFEAENAIGVVLKHITEEPPRPSSLAPGRGPAPRGGVHARAAEGARRALPDRARNAGEHPRRHRERGAGVGRRRAGWGERAGDDGDACAGDGGDGAD